jgi:hypothetical protein
MILKWIIEKLDGGIDWIDLSADKDSWWALLHGVSKFMQFGEMRASLVLCLHLIRAHLN